MVNTDNNDIDALLDLLTLARNGFIAGVDHQHAASQHAALTALVSERDKARQALQKSHDAMVLAKASHGCILACDPPLDAWKHRCVDVHLGDAIRECAAAMRKGEA